MATDNSATINDHYKDPRWQKMRLEILERDGWACAACSDTKSTLHVHHIVYRGMPWEAPEGLLQTLCETCHTALGPHPKGGVAWLRDKDGPYVYIFCCPKCKSTAFRENHDQSISCASCPWSCDYKDFQFAENVAIQKHEEPESKPTTKPAYNLAWLKGMLKRVRKTVVTDVDLFDALFPFSVARESYFSLLIQVKTLLDSNDGLSVAEECDLVCTMIKTRAIIREKIAGLKGDSTPIKEAMDGQNP